MRKVVQYLLSGAVALGLAGPAGAQPPPNPVPPNPAQGYAIPAAPSDAEYLNNIRQWSRRLSDDLAYLMQDISVELQGQPGFRLQQRANEAYAAATAFHRSVRAGIPRDQLYRQFNDMDRRLHQVLDEIRRMPNARTLVRSANRVQTDDQQLHYAISQGDSAQDQGAQVLQRQIDLLTSQGAELRRLVHYYAENGGLQAGVDDRLRKSARDFAAAAEHLSKVMQSGPNRDFLQRNLGDASTAWRYVVEELNSINPANPYLLNEARQIQDTYLRILAMLNLRDPGFRVRD